MIINIIYDYAPQAHCEGPTEVSNQNQKDYHIISLEHLQEIKITCSYMRNHEVGLIKFLHTSAPALKKMRIAFISGFMCSQSLDIFFMRSRSLEILGKKCEEFLRSIALGKKGKWVFCNHSFRMQNYPVLEWTQ